MRMRCGMGVAGAPRGGPPARPTERERLRMLAPSAARDRKGGKAPVARPPIGPVAAGSRSHPMRR
jgi:hypothetical protein